MTTLSYAPPSIFVPRYSRLALGSALLAVSTCISFAGFLTLTHLLHLSPSDTAFHILQTLFSSVRCLLLIPAAIAFCTFRPTTSRTRLVVFTALAAAYFLLVLTFNIAFWDVDHTLPLSPTAILELCTLTLCQLLIWTLLTATLVFIFRLGITPITVLAILCFTPTAAVSILSFAFTFLLMLHAVNGFSNPYLGWTLSHGNFIMLLQLLFWLTLTIVALVLAKKSCPTA